MNTITLAALERGLTMQDVRRMQIGQIVDYCIDYNKRQEEAEKAAKKPRAATQADIDKLLG